jgi:hypothetical protein
MTRTSSVDTTVTAAVLLGVTALAGALMLVEAGGVVRLVAVLVFFLVVPGWAVVAFARPAAVTARVVTVSVAVSVAVDVLVAQAMLLTGGWQPRLAFAVLAMASAVLLLVHLVREALT